MNTPVNLFKQALQNKQPQIGLWMGLASAYLSLIHISEPTRPY